MKFKSRTLNRHTYLTYVLPFPYLILFVFLLQRLLEWDLWVCVCFIIFNIKTACNLNGILFNSMLPSSNLKAYQFEKPIQYLFGQKIVHVAISRFSPITLWKLNKSCNFFFPFSLFNLQYLFSSVDMDVRDLCHLYEYLYFFSKCILSIFCMHSARIFQFNVF